MNSEGPATCNLNTGFLGFPLTSSTCRDVSEDPSGCCLLLIEPSCFKLIKIKRRSCKDSQKLSFQITQLKIKKIQMLHPSP
jgi:hypothetical protein